MAQNGSWDRLRFIYIKTSSTCLYQHQTHFTHHQTFRNPLILWGAQHPQKKKVAEIKSEPIRGQRLMWRPRTRAMRDAAGKRVSYVPTTSGCCHKSEINQLTSRVEGLLIWNLYEKQFKHFNRKCCPEIGYEPQSIALSLFRFDGSLCVTLSGVKCWDRSSSDWNQVRTWDLWLKYRVLKMGWDLWAYLVDK